MNNIRNYTDYLVDLVYDRIETFFGSNSIDNIIQNNIIIPHIHNKNMLSYHEYYFKVVGNEKYFLEIASDVFFKVQAGWTRRDIASYRHLLGDQLASEYERHFAEMKEQGVLSKLESIAIRNVEIVVAGSENGEDFVTVLFTANLLDYKVDEKSGDIIEGSDTEPVKFVEEWTWARPIRTEDWKLEGIKVIEG